MFFIGWYWPIGSVTLEFTVSELGTVVDIVVVESDPPGIFEYDALKAVKGYKYKPKVVDGRRVAIDGVRTTVTFRIAD